MKYSTDRTVYQMVLDRLPFVADTDNNTAIIGSFIAEIMEELEPCFQVANQTNPPSPERVGDDDYYTMPQKALVADLASIYVLQRKAAENLYPNESSTDTTNPNTYLKSAKAGTAEVEWGQIDFTKTGSSVTSGTLMDKLLANAIRKGRNMGCLIDICADCALSVSSMTNGLLNFVTLGGCSGCSQNKFIPKEQGGH